MKKKELFNTIRNLNKEFEKKFKEHHKLYPEIRIKSIYWEHIFEQILKSKIEKIEEVIWDSKSHRQGTDIELHFKDKNKVHLSMKSGEVKGNFVKVSSFRTSSYKTIQEKLDHSFKVMGEEDFVIYLTYDENNKEYDAFMVESSVLIKKMKELKWEEKISDNGNTKFAGKTDDFNAAFMESMSGQLWYSIHQKYLTRLFSIKV